ncbi:MAG: hypothetical protein P8M78_16665 [Myxococcota bacterium]|nr:hypothetical protein [Myxococcota bacterium]
MRIRRKYHQGFAWILFLACGMPAASWAGDDYGLPFCQMIYDDTDRPPQIRQAQLDYCDLAEDALVDFVASGPSEGMSPEEVYAFSMLFFASAHWERLSDIEIAMQTCGDGICQSGESISQCPADCGSGGGDPGDPNGSGEGAGQ